MELSPPGPGRRVDRGTAIRVTEEGGGDAVEIDSQACLCFVPEGGAGTAAFWSSWAADPQGRPEGSVSESKGCGWPGQAGPSRSGPGTHLPWVQRMKHRAVARGLGGWRAGWRAKGGQEGDAWLLGTCQEPGWHRPQPTSWDCSALRGGWEGSSQCSSEYCSVPYPYRATTSKLGGETNHHIFCSEISRLARAQLRWFISAEWVDFGLLSGGCPYGWLLTGRSLGGGLVACPVVVWPFRGACASWGSVAGSQREKPTRTGRSSAGMLTAQSWGTH